MTKAELLSLSRDELIERARDAGISGAADLTRADLVDELARHSAAAAPDAEPAPEKPRGFFGRARALIARVIEKGLHLPSAVSFRDGAREQAARAPLPTVTLARIYLSQGHTARATDVLREVLLRDPTDTEAQQLLAELAGETAAKAPVIAGSSTSAIPVPPPAVPVVLDPSLPASPPATEANVVEVAPAPPPAPGGSGPKPMLDDAPLPVRYDVDEAVVMAVDPTTAYVYWEVRPSTMSRLRSAAPHGRLVVRLHLSFAGREARRDIYPDTDIGDVFVDELPDGARMHATLGYLVDGELAPVVQGPATMSPPATMATRLADSRASWTPEHTAMIPGPLPPAVALSIALAHTTDPSLQPQLDVLARIPGFSAAVAEVGDGGRAVDAGDGEDEPFVGPAYLLGARAGDRLVARSVDGTRAPAGSRPLGSSDLSAPLGSSELRA